MSRFRRSFIVAAIGVCILALAQSADAAPTRRGQPSYANIPQIAKINEEIRKVWTDYSIQPSAEATDGEWCRRVYLDILGRIPSVDELNTFVSDSDTNKKLNLVNSLLYDEKYTEEYARNWTTIWTTVLIGRSGGNDDEDLTSREGMQKYLRDSFARNKPYDRMVYELVTAVGATSPGAENFNGAVNFLVNKVNEEQGTLATAATSKTFLGLQVQCTQCHNHPFNDWKQQKFWEMNAFFRQSRALRRFVPGTRDIQSAELINEDFAGEGSDPEEAEIYYELRNGELKVAYPVFVDGTALTEIHGTDLGNSGFIEDVERRTELGKLVVKSEFMDKMIANRMWAHFMGYGFTKPIDDLGPHNPPSHPALLEYLGQEVRKNSFNLKELVKWIVLSEPYSLSSKMNSSNKLDDPLLGESPKFSHFYLRQMRAEELYESLLVATEAHKTRGSYEEQERAKNQWLQQFVVAFGTDEGDETTTFNGTIPQVLMMFNGDLIKQATSVEKGSMLWEIAAGNKRNSDKIEHLFLAALARKPNRNELEAANRLLALRLQDSKGDINAATVAALQDIWWAVLNSNEFIFNH